MAFASGHEGAVKFGVILGFMARLMRRPRPWVCLGRRTPRAFVPHTLNIFTQKTVKDKLGMDVTAGTKECVSLQERNTYAGAGKDSLAAHRSEHGFLGG